MGSFRCHVSVANITHLSFWEYRLSVSRQTLWVVEWGLAIPAIPYCRGKNSRSKKIGQTTQKMIHFVPNMTVCFLENLSTCSRTQNVKNFGILEKNEKYLKQRDFRICRYLHFFCVFFGGFAGCFLSRLRRCKYVSAFVSPSPKTCNQSPRIDDQSSI